MTDAEILTKVKNGLGITGEYQDDTLSVYINDIKDFMARAGVPTSVINSSASAGAIMRGVADLWNYGSGAGKLSPYFTQRVTQLARAGEEETGA